MQLTTEQKQDIQTIMNDAKDWQVENDIVTGKQIGRAHV